MSYVVRLARSFSLPTPFFATYQPTKLAAIEGRYDTERPTPLTVFGMRYALEIPELGSLVLTHSLNGEIKGLKEWPDAQYQHTARGIRACGETVAPRYDGVAIAQ